MSRIAQDSNFNCKRLSGLSLLSFSACFENSQHQEVIAVSIKLKEVDLYQRFFLQAGIGFWEEWSAEEMADELKDENNEIILSPSAGESIALKSVTCVGNEIEMSKIRFVFEDTEYLLKPIKDSDIDSMSTLTRL